MSKIELLAPAGSREALQAAVENGADAVYFGGQVFNARQNAANFTIAEINESLAYLHSKNRQGFITLNTLIANHEIVDLLEYVYDIAQAGVDGVIVQDLGVVQLLRETLPELPIHASTQMAVHNLQGVKYLQDLGLKRVVLAREMSLAEIKEITNKCDVEIETFVHGALCISYSGRCLMSSFLGGRSGNRGTCAQPCRLPYSLMMNNQEVEAEGKHLLSPRDLNMVEHIPQLIQSGINSLKIEGRMKRPEYVATVVRCYRHAIDSFYQGQFKVTKKDRDDLLQIFNRQFTTGYYFDKPAKNLMSYEKPDNRGVFLGEALEGKNKSVKVKLSAPIAEEDGYLFITPKGKEIAGLVHNLKLTKENKSWLGSFAVPENIPPKSKLYRTSSKELLKEAKASYQITAKAQDSEPADFYFTAKLAQPLKLIAVTADGRYSEKESEYTAQKAINRAATAETVRQQLDRLGGSGYELGQTEIIIDEDLMLPASEINKLRREVLEEISAQRVSAEEETAEESFFADDYTKEDFLEEAEDFLQTIPPQVLGYTDTKLTVEVSDFEALKAAVQAGADCLIAKWHSWRQLKYFTAAEIKEAIALCHEKKKEIWLSFNPIWVNDEEEILRQKMHLARDCDADGVYAADLGALNLAKEAGIENIAVDYAFNTYNDLAINFFLKENVTRIALSAEMNLEEISNLTYLGNIPIEILIHGNFPLMVSNYCAIGAVKDKASKVPCSYACLKGDFALKDRMNCQFPLLTDDHCRMYIYNSKTLNIYKRLDEIIALSPDYLRIMACGENMEWIKETVSAYRLAIDSLARNAKLPPSTSSLINDTQNSTYGHFYRGV